MKVDIKHWSLLRKTNFNSYRNLITKFEMQLRRFWWPPDKENIFSSGTSGAP